MTTKFESNHIIRFPDCDPYNHLNNGRYMDYFMNAREDHIIEHYNFNMYHHAIKTGEAWVVYQNLTAYLAPVLLMEQVVITSQLIEWNDRKTTVEMQMWNKDKTVLKAVLWTKFHHFNIKTNKSIDHSEEIKSIFKIPNHSSTSEISFDERVKQLRKTGYTKD